MDYKAMLAVSIPAGLSIVAIFSAIALGKVVTSAMEATGRQPEAAKNILINMATGCAFIEALTIYALAFAFALAGKL